MVYQHGPWNRDELAAIFHHRFNGSSGRTVVPWKSTPVLIVHKTPRSAGCENDIHRKTCWILNHFFCPGQTNPHRAEKA
jgi:hypothetical protein